MTVRGGDDYKKEKNALNFDNIPTLVFYPFSGAWNLIWRLCWSSGDVIDSPCAKFKLALFGLPSKTPSDSLKIQGPLALLLFLNFHSLYLSHLNLHHLGLQFLLILIFSLLLYPRQHQVNGVVCF